MRLLISVVDAAEAREAAASGAHIVDVKDPATGALGAAAPGVVAAIRAAIPTGVPLSVALGDGPFEPAVAAAAARAVALAGVHFVKLGLRETPVSRAVETLRAVRATLPREVGVVAAGFADFRRAGAPPPPELPPLVAAAGAQGCLLDTAVKDGRGLFGWLDDDALVGLVAACRAHGLLSALAGSLALEDLPRLAAIGPDIAGMRGAACVGDRVRGRVSGERVRALARALADQVTSVP